VSSTNFVDFSLRQNKSIERLIVFDGLRKTIRELNLEDIVYVGLGSVWFTDFGLAHHLLSIETMISIEQDDVIFRRAQFNQPFRTVEVILGESAKVIPDLLTRAFLRDRPWIVWLDYDKKIDETRLAELRNLVKTLPPNSTLIVTCSARLTHYGKKPERVAVLRELFGDVLDERVSTEDVETEVGLMRVLASTLSRYLKATALQVARPGGLEVAFALTYRDGTPMVTVGGMMPSPDNVEACTNCIADSSWRGLVERPIITPPLTAKEVAFLQAQLPRSGSITRAEVQAMGFDLEEDQIESYVEHYLLYPAFAQISR